ncbi:MAG: hypothetical protein K6G38_02550 [Gammaproteobacteria bacterium]|nr:hypothetical protein [Gammaproteobacteria bacterium]
MKIDILKESGFCGGVTRTLYILDKTIKEHQGEQIYLLGPIVHNMLVNNEYRDKGLIFVDNSMLDKLPDGALLVISAHGKSDREISKLSRFNVIDTTCPYVKKNKKLVKDNEANNIIFIGKRNHSETKAICGDNDDIYIVENEDDIKDLTSNSFGVVFNQTTFNISKLAKLQDLIRENCPYFEIKDTMCPSAKGLQQFLNSKDDRYNVCIVVGDKTSSNANALYEMSPYHPTYFIASENDIDNIKLRINDNIIIIGSASTPKKELEKIKARIRKNALDKKTL